MAVKWNMTVLLLLRELPPAAIAAGLGFCSEDRKLDGVVPDMSVREKFDFGVIAAPRPSRSGGSGKNSAKWLTDLFGASQSSVRALTNRFANSRGVTSKKVLPRRAWLCMSPRLLILDEPTRGIDVGAKAEIQSLIGQLASEGLGVLMISFGNGRDFRRLGSGLRAPGG